MIIRQKAQEEHIAVELITLPTEYDIDKRTDYLDKIVSSCQVAGIEFSWKYDDSGASHARHIVTDSGWKISLDRGLDIFQLFAAGDALSLANRFQEHRAIKQFEVTYLRI